MKIFAIAIVFLFSLSGYSRQAATSSPQGDMHHQDVNKRGDHIMGFSHEKTTHHFVLYADGGAIEVEANSTQDAESREQIRMHLSHIAQMFSAGNFSAPMLIHQQNPPGAATMARLRDQIHYKFEDTSRGGMVRIATQNADALRAIHEFLEFQIRDHNTGDSTAVTKAP